MNVELNLTEAEQATLMQLAQAAGQDLDMYLHNVVRSQIECDNDPKSTPPKDHEAWRKRLEALIARSPSVGHVDTSRASFYQ